MNEHETSLTRPLAPQAAAQPPALIQSLADMERVAGFIAKSGLFGTKTPEQAMGLLLIAHAEGVHPATAALSYHIIQGRPTLKADAILARHQAAGGTIQWLERTDKVARAEFSYRGGTPLTVEWTIDMAKAAGLTGKDTWKQYPRAMLSARCIGEGVRAVNPGVITGIYAEEEAFDLPAVRLVDNTAASSSQPSPPIAPAAVLPAPVQHTAQDWSIGESIALLTADDDARPAMLEGVDKLVEVYGEDAVAEALRGAANLKLQKNGPALTEKTVHKALEGLRAKLQKEVELVEGVIA